MYLLFDMNFDPHFFFLTHSHDTKKNKYTHTCYRYDCITLLFSGIVGFAKYCAANTDAEGAMKIVKMLNELYTIFDALCDTKRIPNIYKVSTDNTIWFSSIVQDIHVRIQSFVCSRGFSSVQFCRRIPFNPVDNLSARDITLGIMCWAIFIFFLSFFLSMLLLFILFFIGGLHFYVVLLV